MTCRKLLLGLALTCTLTAAALAADWPGWRGPGRDGKSPDATVLKEWPAEGPKLLWKNDAVGAGYASMAVVDGTTYTAGEVGGKLVLFALDAEGKEKWKQEVDGGWGQFPGSRSTPMVDGDRVYIVSAPGAIACFDAKTGEAKWQKKMADFGGKPAMWGYAESVLILGKLAIVTPGGKNCVVALDKLTGEKVWASQGFDGAAHYCSAIAITEGKSTAICVGTGGGLAFFDAENGKLLGSNTFCAGNTANCPTPAYADGYVFWANGYGKGGVCMKVDVKDGQWTITEAWKTKDMNCHHGGYVIKDGYIYGNNGNGWACLELKTGKTLWNDKGVGKGSVCLVDGELVLFSETAGKVGLAAASPDALKLTGQFSVKGKDKSWAHPIVVGGKMYIRYDTNLYCFDVAGK